MTNNVDTSQVYTATLLPTMQDKEDSQVHWSILLNGQTFEYSEGLGHFLNLPYNKSFKNEPELYNSIAVYLTNINLPLCHAPASVACIRNFREAYNVTTKKDRIKGFTSVRHHILPSWLLPPERDAVLYCLLSDATALDQCFDDWCDDYGYDNDSLSARNIYDACCSNGHKLRKTGLDITAERERLQDY